MTRYVLETHYTCSPYPTVLVFDSEAEAIAHAGREVPKYSGVSHVVIAPLAERCQDNIGAFRGLRNALHIQAAVIAGAWFLLRLAEVVW